MSQAKYFGVKIVKLDDKGRMSLPSSFRDDDYTNTFIRFHEEGFLEVGKMNDLSQLSDTFMQFAAPFYEQFPTPDKENRFVLPKKIRETLLGEDKATSIVIFGRGKTFGICEASNWAKLEKSFLNKFRDILTQKPE